MQKIKEFVKNNRIIYFLYYYIMSFVINIMKLFLKTDDKLILFVSYGGRHFSDSPKVIYDAMKQDKRFESYKLIWAFVEPNKYDVEGKIKIDSWKYYKYALKSRCWITNVMVERALNFKGINTYYFFTTHGMLPKCDGPDVTGKKFSSRAGHQYDCCLAQSEYEKKIAMRMFGISEKVIKIIGYPKDDILVSYTEEYRTKLRKKFNIPSSKKAILYAPTYREDADMKERFEMNIEKWRKQLSEKYVLLYRAHPVIDTTIKMKDSFFYDETEYETVEDLMIVSDILISDYSGIIFDYCIMHKPIFLWGYDYEEYRKRRGLYMDICSELSSSKYEDDIIEMIKNEDFSDNIKRVVKFQEKYETVFGNGTNNSLDLIYKNIRR